MFQFSQRQVSISLGLGVLTGATLVVVAVLRRRRKQLDMATFTQSLNSLEEAHVHIKDRERVDDIIKKISEGGKERLQVIADWDSTLSCFSYKGKPCDSCYNVIDSSPFMPSWYSDEAVKIRDFYYAIEIDHEMTVEQKYPFMVEWWTKAHNLLVKANVSCDMIKMMVRESSIRLREGCDWLFSQTHKQAVPLLIFSAGIGDVIEEVVHQQNYMYDNITLVSNYMDFNHQGKLVGFKGDLIHVFNKNENAIHESDYFEKIRHRDNIILMGDSVGDLHMADGADQCTNILKIGFLNTKVSERLDTYKNLYDIVIVEDETMHIPNAIIRKIFQS